jgi:alpha-amylase/alpha-mannosidase (GH57 family)
MKRNLLSLVALLVGCAHLVLAQPSVVPGGVRFVYTGSEDAKTVSLVGDFNSWSKTSTKMNQLESGQWSVTIQLSPGTYQYAFLVNGKKIATDPNNSLTFHTADGVRVNSLLSLSEENTSIMQGYPVRQNLNDSYEKKGGTIYLNLVFKHHLPLYYDPAKDMITAPFVRMHATRDYFDMTDMILRYPNVHATAAISPTLLWQIDEIYIKRMEPFIKKSKRNRPRKWEINANGFLASMRGKTDPWIDACLTPAENLSETDKAYLYKNEWNAFTMSPVRRQRFPEFMELYEKWNDAKGNPSYTTKELRLLKFFAIFAHFDTEFFERDVPLKQTGTRIKRSLDLRDLVAFRSDGKYYLKREITEQDCNRIVASAYQVMISIIPAFKKAQYNRRGQVGQLELATTSYSDAVLPLLINSDIAKEADPGIKLPSAYKYPSDADAQLQMSVSTFRKYFNNNPAGYVPPFGAISKEVIPYLKKNGFEWFTSAEKVLEKSRPMAMSTTLPYTATVDGATVTGVFANEYLNHRVGWLYRNYYAENAADDFIKYILTMAPSDPKQSALVTVVIDSDEHWMYFQRDIDGKGFMSSVYRKLNKMFKGNRAILSVTMSEYIDGNRGRGIAKHKVDKFKKISSLAAGSGINGNFNTWIGNAEDNTAWEYMKKTRAEIGKVSAPDSSLSYLENIKTNPFTIYYSATTQDWLQRFSDNEVLKLNPKPFESHFFSLLKGASDAAGQSAAPMKPFITAEKYKVSWTKPEQKTRVTFICKLADREAITAVYAVGNRKELANLEPNTVRMWDNAEYGDEKSGDNYWTLVIDLTPGELIYKYCNSGGQGTWDGSEAFPDMWRKVMISGEKMTINDVFARFK